MQIVDRKKIALLSEGREVEGEILFMESKDGQRTLVVECGVCGGREEVQGSPSSNLAVITSTMVAFEKHRCLH